MIDSIYFSIVFPNIKPMHFQRTEDRNQIKNNNTIFLEAERFELLQNLPISLFINVASMQEMNPEIINNYFKYMRTSKNSPCYFYCCNRLEKELPDGTLSEFMNYPWENSDDILIDELCPWYQKYPNWRPPFWRPFDGPHMHRLVNFK